MSENKVRKEFQFIKNSKIGFMISLILIVLSFGSFFKNGIKLGIDFQGGTLLHLKFEKPVNMEKLRKIISEVKVKDKKGNESALSARIQAVSKSNVDKIDNSEIIIQTSLLSLEKRRELKSLIKEKLGVKIEKELRVIDIGPTVGKILKDKATMAVIIALFAILIYVTYRFELIFGIASIVALSHDVLITLGVFSLFSIEMSSSMIAALLTIIGYSLNDTIVISDRIRENSKIQYKDQDGKALNFSEKINKSINQSLSRTINTSITTLFPVLALYFFGGAILSDFALALLIGVIIGTYSSIFVVSPLIVFWNKKSVQTAK